MYFKTIISDFLEVSRNTYKLANNLLMRNFQVSKNKIISIIISKLYPFRWMNVY